MKQTSPDWLRAGSPLSYKWLTDTSNSLDGVTWENIGLISDASYKLSVDLAKDKLDKPVALRIHSSDTHYSEIGWVLKPSDTLQYPVISPSDWTIQWDRWLSGKFSDNELINVLLKSSDSTNLVFQPKIATPAREPKGKLVICSLFTLLLGLLLVLALNEKSTLKDRMSTLQDSILEIQNENNELSEKVENLKKELNQE